MVLYFLEEMTHKNVEGKRPKEFFLGLRFPNQSLPALYSRFQIHMLPTQSCAIPMRQQFLAGLKYDDATRKTFKRVPRHRVHDWYGPPRVEAVTHVMAPWHESVPLSAKFRCKLVCLSTNAQRSIKHSRVYYYTIKPITFFENTFPEDVNDQHEYT